jgi:membrane-associated PAP2 superfamily phosphatase
VSRGRRALLTGAAIAGLAAMALALNRSGADFALSRLAWDAAGARFPWRDHPLLTTVLHDGTRWMATFLALAVLGALAMAHLRPKARLHAYRHALAYLAVAALGSALAVAALKNLSGHSCPWDLSAFGGRFDFSPLLGAPGAHPGPGRCLPSGHASVGFMWIAAVYAQALLPAGAIRLPAPWLAVGVAIAGVVVSAAQVARGAHFASHALLTAATCWAVAWAVAAAWPVPTKG